MSETSIPLAYIIHRCEINPPLISDSLDVFQSLVNASLHISTWNAGQKPHRKKGGILLGSLRLVLGATRLPAPTINVRHSRRPASALLHLYNVTWNYHSGRC